MSGKDPARYLSSRIVATAIPFVLFVRFIAPFRGLGIVHIAIARVGQLCIAYVINFNFME